MCWSPAAVVSSIEDFFPVAQYDYPVIHQIQDTEPKMGIIRTILPRLHRRMDIPLISGKRFWVSPTALASRASSIGVDSSSCCPA